MADGTGIILCRCGPNIGDSVDLERLESSLSGEKGVSWIIQHDMPCSKGGRQDLLKVLRESPIERLVVAGCSPKEREKTFREMMVEAGLNPFMLQMANIREHCAWVEQDRARATAKAERLVRAALARVQHHEPIVQKTVGINPDVLVVGSGIAGMEAALLIAREGRQVHLIEKNASIGGVVPLLGELYPSMECSSCALEPLMDEILHHESIKVHLLSEVVEVRGFYGNFHIDLMTRPRGVDTSACMGCGMCLEVCGVEVSDRINSGFSTRGAIYNEYTGAMPNVPVIDWKNCSRSGGSGCAACVKACPVNAVDLEGGTISESVEVGAVIIATGAELQTIPGGDIISAYQFERLVNPGGGTQGEIVMRSGEAPSTIAVVDEGGDALSGMIAVKTAVTAQEKLKNAKITLMIKGELPDDAGRHSHVSVLEDCPRVDIRVLGRHQSVSVDPEKGTVITGDEALKTDMTVICHAASGASGARQLASDLGIEISRAGFLSSGAELLEPVSSGIPGVFIAGAAAGPATVKEAVLQGAAAAGRALSLLKPGAELELNPFTSQVDEELCSACGTCVSSCPYGAVVRGEDGRPYVEEPLCQGCGVCSSACPSGAMHTKHFTLEQLLAEVGALCSSGER